MLHAKFAAFFCGQKRGHQRGVADASAGELKLASEEGEIDVVGERSAGGNQAAPDPLAILWLGERKLDDVLNAARESIVDVLAKIRGENYDAFVVFHFLQKVGDFDVGVAVVGVLHLRAFAENSVGFVEKQNRVR